MPAGPTCCYRDRRSLASSFDEHFKPAIAGAALMVLLAMLLRMMWRDALPVTAAEIGAPARALE